MSMRQYHLYLKAIIISENITISNLLIKLVNRDDCVPKIECKIPYYISDR